MRDRAGCAGELRAVVTSTSLELGVDIGTADVTVQVGLPGGVARCVQRVGRSGHRRGAGSRGLLLAATPAELAGAIITARAALAGRVEPLRMIRAPLDVVCQQLVSMACAGEQNVDAVFRALPQGRPDGRAGSRGFRRLPRLAGRRAACAGRCVRARAGSRTALDFATNLERARVGSASAAGGSSAGSGATSGRFIPKRRCESWTEAWRSARSRRRTPNG